MMGVILVSVTAPSQYELDKMVKGDIVYVQKRSLLYRLYRKLFRKNLNKVRVRKNYEVETDGYTEYYQEDCVLVYAYEQACCQKFDNAVRVGITNGLNKFTRKWVTLKTLEVSLYNIILQFQNNTAIILPIDYVKAAINKNNVQLQQFDREKIIKDNLKFQKYDGNYFKNYVKDHKIREWNTSYCLLCGKPVKMSFKKDKVIVTNKCECGYNQVDLNTLTYDEFASWYTIQTDKKVKARYKEIWEKKE